MMTQLLMTQQLCKFTITFKLDGLNRPKYPGQNTLTLHGGFGYDDGYFLEIIRIREVVRFYHLNVTRNFQEVQPHWKHELIIRPNIEFLGSLREIDDLAKEI